VKIGIREIVFLVILAGTPVAAWWFVFRPNSAQNKIMMAEIETRQAKLQKLNVATATLGDVKTEIAALEDAIEFFRSKLPSEKEMDKVLREMWRLAEANQLTTKSIRTLKESGQGTLTDPSGPYAEQPISMKLEGPFTGFYGFLLAMESQPRIMRLREMKLKKIDKTEGVVQAECEVLVFFERGGKGS